MNTSSDQPDKPRGSDPAATQTSQTAAERPVPGAVLADRFEIVRLLGVGAMGEVFEAIDQHLDVTVALKILRTDLSENSEALARFRQELLIARRVGHPNVIRLHDMVRDGSRWLLCMEYVDGESLQQRLAREDKLSVAQAVDICKQIARGLSAAHAAGVVHRDLKPANILLAGDRATISDFGIARSLSHAGLTREGLIVGTPDYLSPEQAAGEPVDGRSDLYALGIILCEMLTGDLPFNATTAQEAIGQRLSRSPTPLAGNDDVPDWLVTVCHRLLRRNVRRRYQSAEEVLDDLDRAGRKPKRAWNRWWLVAFGLLVAGVPAATWFLAQRDVTSGQVPVSAAPQALPSLAVLPAAGMPDTQALAVAGYLGDRLPACDDLHVDNTARVAPVLEVLGFDAAAAGRHRTQVAAELGVDQLAVPRWDAGKLQLDLFSKSDGFSEPITRTSAEGVDAAALTPQLLAPLREFLELGEPASDVSWGVDAHFYRGLVMLEQGNAIAAIEHFEQATAEQPESARAWWGLARALEIQGRHETAQDAVLQAGSLVTGEDRYAQLVRVWQALATGNYATSDQLIADLVERYPRDALVLTVAGEYWGDGGDLTRARELLEASVEVNAENPRAWFLLAKFSILMGESQAALDEYLVRALTLQNRLRNRQGQADVINAQGVAYEQLGQLSEAVDAYRRAAELRNEIGDLRGEASTLRNLAAIEAIQGNADAAAAHWEQARSRLESLSDFAGMADLYNDAGVLAEERGDYAAALEHYRESLEIRRRLPNQRSIAESLSNVGYVSYELGQYATARAYLEQALVLFTEAGDQAGQLHSRQNLALLNLATGRLGEAAEALQAVHDVAESLQMSQELSVNQVIEAELDWQRGHYGDALDLADRARAGFEQQADSRGRAESLLVASRVYLSIGATAAAEEMLAASREGQLNADQTTEVTLLTARLALVNSDRTAARTVLEEVEPLGAASAMEALILAEAADENGSERWPDVVAQAETLGHWPLTLEATRMAIVQLVGTSPEVAGDLFLRRWSELEATESDLRERVFYATLGSTLCPIAQRDCDQWQADAETALAESLSHVPPNHRDSFRQLVKP
ncbi:MAG: protein kinase [Xanthomonadales bacterium]|nr:protein kinase [Xanthomonadales bacterium]